VLRHTLSIDYGSRYIGIALLRHTADVANRALYAGVIVVEAGGSKVKPLEKSIKPRARNRRIRRTGKTHRRRLARLRQALRGVKGGEEILRFCRRRGYGYDPKADGDEQRNSRAKRGRKKAASKELTYAVSRDDFFAALSLEIEARVPQADRRYVLKACERHLNAERRRTAELRPARFDNRHPTKCNWQGCRRNVPRKKNAPGEQLAQTLLPWLKPVFDICRRPDEFRSFIERQVARMADLVGAYLSASEPKQKASITRQRNAVYREIREAVEAECRAVDAGKVREKFERNWEKTYEKHLTGMLTKEQSGRLRFCREHSRQYVAYFLAGNQIPQRTEVNTSDLFGRSQQIVCDRIWQFVRARLLPLAGGRIDRVRVERVAFDILEGKLDDRVEAIQDGKVAAEMYWQGPMYGYSGRSEMFEKEFDGRCAYCGQRKRLMQVEHLLHQAQFPFDSYFNVLPACEQCNRNKEARTMLEAGMLIHKDAYKAYSAYVVARKPPHLYHTIKKGMLNLMTKGGSLATAERQLSLLANNLSSIGKTQQGPRPLARYLATKIATTTGECCRPEWISGRHTALYRGILLPEFDKRADKAAGGVVNHAVDAIIAGCKLPAATALENRQWNKQTRDIQTWAEKVRHASPKLVDGVPEVEPVERLEFFENDLGNGYVEIALSAFNWNSQRQSGYQVDAFGQSADGKPLKRKPAQTVFDDLRDRKKESATQIRAIAHPALRAALHGKNDDDAALEFVRWLQRTTAKGLAGAEKTSHPSDKARYAELKVFVNMPAEQFFPAEKSADNQTKGLPTRKRAKIPPTIGIRCASGGTQGKLDVARRIRNSNKCAYYMAQPAVRAMYIGYPADTKGRVNLARPIQLKVTQTYRVLQKVSGKWQPVTKDESNPLHGRVLGDAFDRKGFASRWREQLRSLFRQQKIVRWFRLTQGCFIEKTDGTAFQLRNFSTEKPWMNNAPFANIRRVYRSPLRAIEARTAAAD